MRPPRPVTGPPTAFGVAVAAVSGWALVANLARLGFPATGFDEPFYAIAGWRYIHGENAAVPTHVFSASLDNYEHPPLAKYLFGLAQLFAGHPSVVADRVVAAAATLGTALVLGLWLGRVAGRWVGLGAAAGIAVLPMSVPGLPFRFGRYGYLDPVAEFFAVASVVLAWRWFARTGRAAWWYALATGAAVGLAAASKENGFLGVLGVVLLGLALAGRTRRAVPTRLLQSLAAALLAGLVFLATYLPLGHSISAVRFLLHFQHVHSDLGHPVRFAGRSSTHPPGWAFLWFAQHGLGPFVAVAALICAAAAVVLRHDRVVAWFLAALVGPLVFHMAVARVVLGFYWVMWMPAFLALAALGAAELLRRRPAGPLAATACVAVLAVGSVHDTYRMLTEPTPGSTAAAYPAAVRARDPLVALRLDERSGTTAHDFSGHGHDGRYVGGPALGSAGLLSGDRDGAVRLDGRTQYVSVPGGGWTGTGDYSVAIWFRTTQRGARLAAQDDYVHTKVWDLLLDPAGHLQFMTFRPFTGAGQAATSPGGYADGRPHFALATKAGSHLRLYVDGRPAAAADYPGFLGATPVLPIELGRRGNGTGYFAGTLDEFAFFGHGLSAADAAALERAGTGRS